MNGNIFEYLQEKKGKKTPLLYKLINNLPLTDDDLIYDRNLNLFYSKLTFLPNNLTINGTLHINSSKINKLPNNLTVNGNLELNQTNISELPEDLYVNGELWCLLTPLADEIKKDPSLLEKYSKQVKGKIIYDYYLSILRKN